jgi:hypothetical protein
MARREKEGLTKNSCPERGFDSIKFMLIIILGQYFFSSYKLRHRMQHRAQVLYTDNEPFSITINWKGRHRFLQKHSHLIIQA